MTLSVENNHTLEGKDLEEFFFLLRQPNVGDKKSKAKATNQVLYPS